jgi:hypothetical protein
VSYESVPALFTGICDAIREKDDTTALIPHQDIPDRIRSIRTIDTEIPSNYGLITYTAQIPAAAEIEIS